MDLFMYFLVLIATFIFFIIRGTRQQAKLWETHRAQGEKVAKESLGNQERMIRLLEEIRDRLKA